MIKTILLGFTLTITVATTVTAQSEKDTVVAQVFAAEQHVGSAFRHVANLAILRCPESYAMDMDFVKRVKDHIAPPSSDSGGQRRISKAGHSGFLDGYLYAHGLDRPGVDQAENSARWCEVVDKELRMKGILSGFIMAES